ncbi:MAG: single-stranded-DNA-specific exonuclease RecJ [Dokdonella sp.]
MTTSTVPLTIRQRSVPAGGCDWPDSIHPVLRRIHSSRGVSDPADLEHRLARLLAPNSLGGLDRACELLAKAIDRDAQIVVVGDFDADGATGTAVAIRGLRMLGAKCVAYRVPNRVLHGYGLSPALVATLGAPKPDLIVTVDNGVASLAGVDAANALGIAVLVTDHHLPGPHLPNAAAIVNPNLTGDAFPSKALAGVGVMFYLLLALRAHLRERGAYAIKPEPDLSLLLDLVALGTVADMVPLDRNNRLLVEAGLRRIRARRAVAGITALLESSGRDPARTVASDLGFAVAPRINAAGRLEDMSIGIECLLTDDLYVARELADRLSTINSERREVQSNMLEQAEAATGRWLAQRNGNELPTGLTLFDDQWHPGVVGLVASRIKDRLHRPVIACAPAGDGSDELRGSARSIPGFHIRDALAEVDAMHPGLIGRFGGHAMAAGMTLDRTKLPAFSKAFDEIVSRRLTTESLHAELLTDGALDVADFDLVLARQLRYAGPWGQNYLEPLFDNVFQLLAIKIVAEKHWRLTLQYADRREALEAMLFNAPSQQPQEGPLRVIYQMDLDEWNGRERLRLIARHVLSVSNRN